MHLLSAQRIYSAQCCTARSAAQRWALHSAQRFTAHSVAQCAALYPPAPSSTAQRATLHSAQHYTAPSTASQDKAIRSKRTEHIQRAALNSAQRFSAQRYTARSVVQCAALYSPPPARCIARSIALHRALHCTEHSEPRQGRMQQPPLAQRGLLRFLCSISAHDNRSADTRVRSLCLKRASSISGALGTTAKPNRDVPRNALLCLYSRVCCVVCVRWVGVALVT